VTRAQRAHPPFLEAVREDARVTSAFRGEGKFTGSIDTVRQVARLALVSDAFLGQVLYRAKASLQARKVPILPHIAHRLAIAFAQVYIGDPVVIAPGLYLPHGMVVIDGITELGRGVVVRPFVTIGLKEGNFAGPRIDHNVQIGTGAKIIGPVHIGSGSLIGANAVVLEDVPENSVVAGVPAKVLRRRDEK
jgi:serine O-acetyltransferase